MKRLWIKSPTLDKAADIPETPRLLWVCLEWKKVMDDFFHGEFTVEMPRAQVTSVLRANA